MGMKLGYRYDKNPNISIGMKQNPDIRIGMIENFDTGIGVLLVWFGIDVKVLVSDIGITSDIGRKCLISISLSGMGLNFGYQYRYEFRVSVLVWISSRVSVSGYPCTLCTTAVW